jgi:hypothetical protein
LRGKAIWILSFFTLLSALNAITAIVISINLGIEANFQPYLIDTLTGAIPVYWYLIGSIVGVVIFLAATSASIVSELSKIELLQQINKNTEQLKDGQTLLKTNQEDLIGTAFLLKQNIDQTQKQITHNFSEQEKHLKELHEDSTKKIEEESVSITTKIRKNMKDNFGKQEESLQELHSSLSQRIEGEAIDAKAQVEIKLQTLQTMLQNREKAAKKQEKILTTQKKEIAAIKDQITQIEEQFILPKTLLNSQSNPEKVRGIGPNTNNELKAMGITNIGELIIADPKAVAQKTSASEKMVKKLQGIAQLSMIPSLQDKDIALLEEIGIVDQKNLANQNAIEMGKKIQKTIKDQIEAGKTPEIEQPSIEQIRSWIKYSKQ